MTKQELRNQTRAQCKTITEMLRQDAATNLMHNLQMLVSPAKKIAIYNAHGSEISLLPVILKCIKQHKSLYHPIAYKSNRILRFDEYQHQDYTTVPQLFYPDDYQFINEIKWYNLDLVLLPLVAVDKHATRLGYGGGYYDSTFADINKVDQKPILCGVGFECQMVEKIQSEPWDVKLNYFVSEKQVYKF